MTNHTATIVALKELRLSACVSPRLHAGEARAIDEAVEALEAAGRVIGHLAALHDDVVNSGGTPVPNLSAAAAWRDKHGKAGQ